MIDIFLVSVLSTNIGEHHDKIIFFNYDRYSGRIWAYDSGYI